MTAIAEVLLPMVNQLGIPTFPNFFLTFSCANLKWNELVSIISKLNRCQLSKQDIKNLLYHEKCNPLNKIHF